MDCRISPTTALCHSEPVSEDDSPLARAVAEAKNLCWTKHPMSGNGLLPGGPRTFNSRALVDACIPYELQSRKLYPPVVGASRALREKVEAKYWDVLR